ncbi:MAG: glycosyltransferase [Ferruginibacter sp.]|nr:glycosyltransferase [Ferruginibacter sp.]
MTALLLISFILLIIYSFLLLYYRTGWIRLPRYKPALDAAESALPFISVIIPARNEELHLPLLLKSLSNQSYPQNLFEIILVDDHSTDNTVAYASSFSNVKILHLKDFVPAGGINSYKKKAIETGISQSRGELIVTTDADCIAGNNWLQTIGNFYHRYQPELIVMPVSINCSNRAIEIFQALDFMTLQGITGAAVQLKLNSMCNGANMAYTKKAFHEVNGFQGIDLIASGDDMLLLHKIAKKNPEGIAFIKSPEVIIQTAPVETIREFFNQRIRWASKADKYQDNKILPVLLLVYLLNLLLLIIPITAMFGRSVFNDKAQIGVLGYWLLLLLLKTLIELFFLYPVAVFFKKQQLLWLFPLAQPFHIIYTVIAGWLGKFGHYRWKGRNVK